MGPVSADPDTMPGVPEENSTATPPQPPTNDSSGMNVDRVDGMYPVSFLMSNV